MGNSYFRFKQFLIEQDQAAMKVTTDACLFGSLFTTLLQDKDVPGQVLDIGTGTGLLSLMFAQQFPLAKIDAVEIDESAFTQASANFKASPWKDHIHAVHADITTYQPNKKYEVIICNPPFYEKDLKSPDARRTVALHETHLTLSSLFATISPLLHEQGAFLILLPFHRTSFCKSTALQAGLHCNYEILVRQTPGHHYFRSILKFSRSEGTGISKEIVVKIKDDYSPEFANLLSPFYLAL